MLKSNIFITKFFKINVKNISAFFQFGVHQQASEHTTDPQLVKTDRITGLWYYYFVQFGTLLEIKIIMNYIIFCLLFTCADRDFEILMHFIIFYISSAFCLIRQKKQMYLVAFTFTAKVFVQEWYWSTVQVLFLSELPKHYENITTKIIFSETMLPSQN